ncbi:MAG TPA: hypothetical protein VM051_03595 [Usitatibacter sp.]|nr:hypothetical protein [Usitatibacter sp.]
MSRMTMMVAGLALLAACDAAAFKLQAIGTARDDTILGAAGRQANGFLSLFTSDVHERITRQAYEKAGVNLPDDVLAGVRWNDNPPAIRLGPLVGGCDSRCWASMLRVDRMALEILSRRDKSVAPLRSHFGDMQFLHAMASKAGEPARDTREKSLRWSEFAYRIARGEIGPRANVFELKDSAGILEAATRDWISDLFRGPGKQLWTVQDIFLPKSGDLRRVAFGTFLHLVEDSYSAAHVLRASPRLQSNGCFSYDALDPIIEFHTYLGQDTEKHALCDDAPDWLATPRAGSPVDVLAELVRAFDTGRDWPFVKAILEEKVLRLAPNARAAGVGRCFEPRRDPATETSGPPPKELEPACRGDTP